jgi:hypothetical protein
MRMRHVPERSRANSKVRLDAFRVSRRIFRSLSKLSNRVPITGSVVRVHKVALFSINARADKAVSLNRQSR